MKRALLLLVCFVLANTTFSQDYSFYFQGESIEIPENAATFTWAEMPESAEFANGYYGWIQFYETPKQITQDFFNSDGRQLIEYIDNKTYLFYFPQVPSSSLQTRGVRGIIALDASHKLSQELKQRDIGSWAIEGNNVLVTLQHYENIPEQYVVNQLALQQIDVRQSYKGSNNITVSIPMDNLERIANLNWVKWMEVIPAPPVKDDFRGRALHRSNGLDTQTIGGRNYTGAGIGVMVRDDGIVGPHIDFEGRIDNSGASGTGQTHGDGVAGIMAGAGNLDPTKRGMAAGADVYVVNYVASHLDGATTSLINNGSVQITNSSYSDGCNAGYTSVTQTVDQQVIDTPSLLHVFSAGNSNNNNCGYGAGNQWGNITGGHKQGKNVIATANVFYDGSLVSSSSRGPAHDGRIKPDITANGQNQLSTDENNGYLTFGGTSGAAPGIAGISAQLYELYGDLNSGALPPSPLIKATLMNTANDYGNVGPDFKFGWGIVNGFRAGLLLEEGRYLNSTVSQGNNNDHVINVPSGTTQVRFMLYWRDPAAAAGVSTALVNDLDLVVTDPSSSQLLPWILDETPNPTTLDLPATNGVDRLNNVEQVLINNPAAGNYTINVDGFDVPSGPQEYYIVYEVIQDKLVMTYPNGNEQFVPGEQEAIHWDATNTSGDFVLEYSTDNGASWNNITTVTAPTRNYLWTIPSALTGEALIRVTSGSDSDQSDSNFSIAPLVSGLSLNQVCPDQVSLSWNALSGAESYDVYFLGQKYMEVVGNSATNSIVVPITDNTQPIWYAIVAKNATDGWSSRRTNALNHPGGLLNCNLANDLALAEIESDPNQFSAACSPFDGTVTVRLVNTGTDPQSNFPVSYQLDSETPVQETYTGTINPGQSVSHSFATQISISSNGAYTLTATVGLVGDQDGTNDTSSLDFYSQITGTGLPFSQDLEGSFPPAGWSVENPDASTTWIQRANTIGPTGSPTNALYIDNYNYNASGQQDIFISEIYDLGAGSPILSFDLAKAHYSSTLRDALRVEISTDCGATFTEIYYKEEDALSTVPDQTSVFSPNNASQWRNEQIDLALYAGQTAQFRITNINDYGNSTFIDNINADTTLGVQEISFVDARMYPNPASTEISIRMMNSAMSDIRITNYTGQTIDHIQNVKSATAMKIDISRYASGVYFVIIKDEEGRRSVKKLLVQ